MRFIISFILFTVFFSASSQENKSQTLDSIDVLRALSFNEKLSDDTRILYAKRAVELSESIGIDSVILRSGRVEGELYGLLDMNDLWEQKNQANLKLAKKLKDTTALAVANINIGMAKQYFVLEYDSAYYYYKRALKYYTYLGNVNLRATIYRYIAEIQNEEKLYVACEENAIQAIRLYNTLPKTESVLDDLWSVNNLLGNVSSALERYKESFKYYDKALEIADKMEDGDYNKVITYNNQAAVYREILDYDKTIELYENLVERRSMYEPYDPTFYPLVLDNLAFTKVLAGHKDYDSISNMLYEAYRISDTLDVINNEITKLGITIDISKFYKQIKDRDSTLKYAQKAYDLSKKISSNDILLESMVLLSELKSDEEGKKYLNEYIKLSDSLHKIDRLARNKYARIEYETDQLEAENKQISKENLYLLILSAGLLLTAILVYVIISQRVKNKELKLIQAQQKANEDIYNLMLSQQDKVDEARAKEKIRVSKELHDGVLGRLFGTRLSLDSINFKEGKDAMITRANYISQLKTIEEDIRKISHELNTDFVSGSGFMDIVTELIETQTQAYGLDHDFNFTDDISWDLVVNKTKINIYRIIQESMQNIYKHANAKAIKISISLKNDVICLDIIDDGDGFDTAKSKKGIGLKNMNSRVEDINGKIAFTSQSGTGTEVNVKIPYIKQSA